MRISIYRMGVTYFFESPWYGWGDTGWLKNIDKPKFQQYATEFTRLAPINGFHNEIITNSVRSGIWGLLATFSFFVIFLLRAIQGLKLNINREHRLVSITLLIFISHLFFTGLTTEFTNLVFSSSFIGLTLAVLLGEQNYLEEKLSLHAKI
jgi:O-antigen ligase